MDIEFKKETDQLDMITNVYMDTEFLEDGNTIDLISIGLVFDDTEYYAVSNSFNFDKVWADDWVRTNVLLPIAGEYLDLSNSDKEAIRRCINRIGKPNEEIKEDILRLLSHIPVDFYTYYGAYDWVVFCRLFGKMIDLPKNFPMFSIDLKQIMVYEHLTKEWKRLNCPDPVGEHNALIDAKWNRRLHDKIKGCTGNIF